MRTKVKPTGAELEVLQVLWQAGPSTVRDIHNALRKTHSTGYTTVLKIMQIMHEKGLLERDASARAHIYASLVTKEDTQGQFVNDLVSKVFAGSTSQLVVRALSEKSSKKEIEEIRAVLNRLEGK
ncbi:MAG: BlaI/MecI/CopY family transcriptional regulator [Kangiellaceae bacterium]|nr:BlaI/MecI/CopY family transcriptional regulator [Kangiellaceae bacterium]